MTYVGHIHTSLLLHLLFLLPLGPFFLLYPPRQTIIAHLSNLYSQLSTPPSNTPHNPVTSGRDSHAVVCVPSEIDTHTCIHNMQVFITWTHVCT